MLRRAIPFLLLLVTCISVHATFEFIKTLSPRNERRPRLKKVEFIILHTTEGSASGALRKLRRYGEAHYMVDIQGRIFQLMNEDRLARHAGRSMWGGRRGIDEASIGIEMEGFHNKPLTRVQELALGDLLRELKARHRISDDHVLTHSMVAYGTPNRWHSQAHRGRKRCGMNMADKNVRQRLGIGFGPSRDPDVDGKRLAVADPWLQRVLYGNAAEAEEITRGVYSGNDVQTISKSRSAWFIARDRYDSSSTLYTLPDGRQVRGHQIRNWSRVPIGTRVSFVSETEPLDAAEPTPSVEPTPSMEVGAADAESDESVSMKEIGVHGNTAFAIARSEYARATTIYFFPNGIVRTGQQLQNSDPSRLDRLPRGTKILVGYVYGGFVMRQRSVSTIAGRRWNSPATFYRLANGAIMTGDDVNEHTVPAGTLVFFER